MLQNPPNAEYHCPGETCGISRAVHLGRLTSFHPACRHCPCHDDTLGLSARQIRQLAEVGSRARPQPVFCAEGVGNVAINDLSPGVARRIAIEFAQRITRDKLATCPTPAPNHQPMAVVASDGRLATAAIITAVVDGLRWASCETIDIGPASAPCAARAIQHLTADGGVFVGNAGGAPHTVGLKFWAQDTPLSQGGLLDEIAASLLARGGEALIDRPTRTFGTLRRLAAVDVYLNDLRPAYHALRPLRFILDCTVGPVVAYLKELTRNVACQIISGENGRLGEQVLATEAHFGIQIDDDGENCCVVDERGQSVAAERLAAMIAEGFARPVMQGDELRQETFLHMRESGAAIAADPAGRLWYAAGHAPLPDALQTLTLVLVLLSRKDLAFSALVEGKE